MIQLYSYRPDAFESFDKLIRRLLTLHCLLCNANIWGFGCHLSIPSHSSLLAAKPKDADSRATSNKLGVRGTGRVILLTLS